MQTQLHDMRTELINRVRNLLKGCLGATPYSAEVSLRNRLITGGPLSLGVQTGVAYGLLFCLLPLVFFGWQPLLFCLSVYGSLYAAWATTIARLTSAKVLETIEYRIVPALSKEAVANIDDELGRRFKETRISLISWIAAIVGAVAVGCAISRDVPHTSLFQIVWWSVGWLLLFVTAARTTLVARFYRVFAEHLNAVQDIYVLDPAHSTLVKSIAAVGQHVLFFWVGIAVSIALLIPFVSLGSNLLGSDLASEFPYFKWRSLLLLPRDSWFVWIVVPITTFFSIPVGSYVFLRSESAIRKAVSEAVYKTLRATEFEIDDLFARRSDLNVSEWNRVHELQVFAQVPSNGRFLPKLLHQRAELAGPTHCTDSAAP